MAPSPSCFRLVLLNVITNISPCLPSTIFALHTLEPVYAPPGAGMRHKKGAAARFFRAAAPLWGQCAFVKSAGQTQPFCRNTCCSTRATPYSVLGGARYGTRLRSSGLPFSIRKP